MRSKATRLKIITVDSVHDILNYFDTDYHRLDCPVQEIGALYLLVELNKLNDKAEAFMCGLALGSFDKTAHPRQSWAITHLAQFQKRTRKQRAAYVASQTRSLRLKTESANVEM